MKISVLCENTAKSGFLAEHGLSLYIQTLGKRILFDFGQSDLFYTNALSLGIDLECVDAIVLSHGHYDHGGGIDKLLKANRNARVYLSSCAFGAYYNGVQKYIGLDTKLFSDDRIVCVSEDTRLFDNISVVSLNDKIPESEIDSMGLTVFEAGIHRPDHFFHEQYLVIEEQGRRYVFSGCAHKGVVNIVKCLKPHVFVGGFHLSKIATEGQDAKYLNEVAASLLKTGADYYTCHCTGVKQYEYLKTLMGDKLSYVSAGTVVEM